jgi:hypothetical protein
LDKPKEKEEFLNQEKNYKTLGYIENIAYLSVD